MVRRILKIGKRIVQVLLGIIALVFLVCSFYNETSPRAPKYAMEGLNRDPIVPSYKRCVGIDYEGIIDYAWLVSEYGEPDSIEAVEVGDEPYWYRVFVSYDGLRFIFWADDEEELNNEDTWELESITTTDPEHYFGISKIHVGSKRRAVRWAYRWALDDPTLPKGDRYTDGTIWSFVNFAYDENDIVTSINFGYWM